MDLLDLWKKDCLPSLTTMHGSHGDSCMIQHLKESKFIVYNIYLARKFIEILHVHVLVYMYNKKLNGN